MARSIAEKKASRLREAEDVWAKGGAWDTGAGPYPLPADFGGEADLRRRAYLAGSDDQGKE